MVLGFRQIHPVTKELTFFEQKILDGTKIHSIRAGSRWKAGTKIHFATGVRSKKYDCFKEGECVSVQTIIIHPPHSGSDTGLVMIDGNGLNEYTKALLATNDGFDNVEDFFKWFGKKIFRGQIIHWTKYKY